MAFVSATPLCRGMHGILSVCVCMVVMGTSRHEFPHCVKCLYGYTVLIIVSTHVVFRNLSFEFPIAVSQEIVCLSSLCLGLCLSVCCLLRCVCVQSRSLLLVAIKW